MNDPRLSPKRFQGGGDKAWWYEEPRGISIYIDHRACPAGVGGVLVIPWRHVLAAAQRSSGREVIVKTGKRPMTEREFLRRLGKYKGKFYVRDDNAIRGLGCPVEVVAGLVPYSYNGGPVPKMDISARLGEAVMDSADCAPVDLAPRSVRLRAKMLRVLGLKERA